MYRRGKKLRHGICPGWKNDGRENVLGGKNDWREYILGVKNDGREYPDDKYSIKTLFLK